MFIKTLNSIPSTNLKAGKSASMQMLISPEEAPNFAMRKFIIKSGGNMPMHTNSVEHEQYVLSGSAIVRIENKTYIVKKDDILFIPAGTAHSYEVIGDDDYEFLCLIPNKADEIKIIEQSSNC